MDEFRNERLMKIALSSLIRVGVIASARILTIESP